MGNKIINIVTDAEKFQERVDEIESAISYDKVLHTISDIKKALYDHPEVAAMCAPQIGESLRLFVVKQAKSESERFKVFLNPLIVSGEGLHWSRENNVSFPDKQFIIPRRNKIHVAYQAANGEISSETYSGAYAEVIQQMIEMLDGITLLDYGFDLDDVGGADAFDKATQKDKATVLQMYMESLKGVSDELKTEIDSDESLSNINKTIDFMTGMITGDIIPMDENGNLVDEEYKKKLAQEKADKIMKELKEKKSKK